MTATPTENHDQGRGPLRVTLLDAFDHESGVGDERGDVAREMAAVGEPSLERLEPALPDDDRRVGGKAVLEKVKATPGTNDTT